MTDLISITPLLVVFFAPLVLMAVVALSLNFKSTLFLAFLGVLLALFSLASLMNAPPLNIGRFFVADAFTSVCQAGLLLAALVVIVFSREWFAFSKERTSEYSISLLISLFGAMALVMSSHFLSFFISLELLSIPIYVLIAYHVRERRGLEAALKYILLAGFSVAVLLFGIALIYKEVGTLEFDGILARVQLLGPLTTPLAVVGFLLFFCGVAFKIGLVPFHMWLPDVYEGAPIAVTAFLTTVSKGAVLLFTLRFLNQVGTSNLPSITSLLTIFAVLSMFLGNIMALKQQNLKRLLAYSSIAQVGYMFLGVLSGGSQMISSTLFFVFGYFAAILCALGVILLHARNDEEREQVKSLEGLFFLKPALAIAFTVSLLSFTGLPLTVGFIGKFFVLLAGVDSLRWLLVISLVGSSAIGFYAYFKVIISMANRGSVSIIPMAFKPSVTEFVVIGLGCAVLYFGLMPTELTNFVAMAAAF